MKTDEKIRSLINPRLREIHANIQGILSMGDLAVYVGQPMQDAMEELATFCATLTEALTTAERSLGFLPQVNMQGRDDSAKLKELAECRIEAIRILPEIGAALAAAKKARG